MGADDRIDETIREAAAREYNRPPPTPREDMWASLEARLERREADAPGVAGPGGPGGPGRNGPAGHATADVVPIERAARRRDEPGDGTRWMGLAVAAGAALLLGVGIGRMSAPAAPDATPVVASASEARPGAPAEAGGAVRTVTARHLAASESLLGFVQADARAGRFDDEVGRWGRGLLLETRLLLDSEAGRDPALRDLLLDLEMILAQVAMLAGTDAPERGREELRLIAQGLEEQQMMARIQTALPAADATLSGT
jgi:hypothetical protein